MNDFLLNLPWRDLLKALVATIVIEEMIALFWKERSFRLAAVVFAANVATNPTLNVVFISCSNWIYVSEFRTNASVWLGELAVWCAETAIFWQWGRLTFKRAAFFSLALNAASYWSGRPLEALGFWNW